jgi:hypothetical protein
MMKVVVVMKLHLTKKIALLRVRSARQKLQIKIRWVLPEVQNINRGHDLLQRVSTRRVGLELNKIEAEREEMKTGACHVVALKVFQAHGLLKS